MNIKVDPDWWKTMFDKIYLITDSRSVGDENITRKEVDLICELIPINFRYKILDLCGGHGRHSFELYSRGYPECTLLDYSKYLIEHAKSYAEKNNIPVNFIRSDARNSGLPSESFDLTIIMGNSLGYLELPSADAQILSEAYRLLRRGGWLLVDVTDGSEVKESFIPNSWHEIGNDILVCRQREIEGETVKAREVVISRQKGLIRDQTYAIRIYEQPALADLLEQTGLKQVKIHTDFSPFSVKGDYGFMSQRMIATGRKI